MRIETTPAFRTDCLRAEAEAMGQLARLEALVLARTDDGMDEADAWDDACVTLGLAARWESRLAEAARVLEPQELTTLVVESAHAGMPKLRRDEPRAVFSHDAAPLEALATVLEGLAARLASDPGLGAAVEVRGLGGTGGCAAGECLPEDAPPGPLFAR